MSIFSLLFGMILSPDCIVETSGAPDMGHHIWVLSPAASLCVETWVEEPVLGSTSNGAFNAIWLRTADPEDLFVTLK